MGEEEWKVQTIDGYRRDLKKKVWEIETLCEFRDFLNGLANSSLGLVFYKPLADKFDEIYSRVRWNYRFILITGFVLGTVFGCLLMVLLGGF